MTSNIQTFITVKQLPRPLWMFGYRADIASAIANQVGVNGDVYLTPFYTPFPITISRYDLILGVLGGAGTNLRLGLYSSASQTAPTPDSGTLLWDSGNIAADATAAKDIAVTPNVTVSGWFFAALETNDGTIQYPRYGATQLWVNQGTEKIEGRKFNQVFGALPSTVPATSTSLTANHVSVLRYT